MVDLEEIQCPFCNLNDSFPIWKENGYTGNKCAKCGLIFISPRPTIQSMAELYDLEQTAGKSVQEHFTYHYSEHLHNKKILDILHKYKPNGTLLEIGPGGGHFILQAQERGYKLHAIEINKEQAEKIHSNMKIPVACGPVDDVSLFQGEQFDIIFHKDVLSHLHYPIEVFRHLHSKLRPNGLMVFETGNGGDLTEKWLKRLKKLSYPEHLFLMSQRNIKELLTLTGFKLLTCRHYVLIIPLLRIMLKSGTESSNISKKQGEIDKPNAENNHFKLPDYSLKHKIKGRLSYFLNYQLSQLFPKKWPSSNIYIVQKVSQ